MFTLRLSTGLDGSKDLYRDCLFQASPQNLLAPMLSKRTTCSEDLYYDPSSPGLSTGLACPRALHEFCLLKSSLHGLLTPKLSTRITRHRALYKACSIHGAHAQDPKSRRVGPEQDHTLVYTLVSALAFAQEPTDNESTPRTQSLRLGHQVYTKDTDSANRSEITPRSLCPGA